jgi:hypothetical protein
MANIPSTAELDSALAEVLPSPDSIHRKLCAAVLLERTLRRLLRLSLRAQREHRELEQPAAVRAGRQP